VDITVKKQGDALPPDDGVVVKTADTLQVALAPTYYNQTNQIQDLITWEYRQLRGDGTWGSSGSNGDNVGWMSLGSNYQGTTFDYQTTKGGIFELRAKITVNKAVQTYDYVRKKDVPVASATESGGAYNESYRKGKDDFFGVADTDIQINLRNTAKSFLGSTAYSEAADIPLYYGGPSEKGHPKCNIFVYQMGNAAGASVPLLSYDYTVQSNGQVTFEERPPIVKDWYNYGVPISGWNSMTDPQPGYVVSCYKPALTWIVGLIPFPTAIHHSGIVDYDGAWIGAGELTVNKWANIWNTPIVMPGHYRKFTGDGN
jgi:hypothetical protein